MFKHDFLFHIEFEFPEPSIQKNRHYVHVSYIYSVYTIHDYFILCDHIFVGSFSTRTRRPKLKRQIMTSLA